MAQTLTTANGTLIVPQAAVSQTVAAGGGGIGAAGIVALVGESSDGEAFSEEADLEETASFGPDELSVVAAKYGSGPLVDAYTKAARPSADPEITGGPTRIVLVKTNVGGRASAGLETHAATPYGTLQAAAIGRSGNQISFEVREDVAEVPPNVGPVAYIPAVGTVNIQLRTNGGAALIANLAANATPTTAVSTLNALAGVGATGGANRAAFAASGTVGVTASGNQITVTTSVALAVVPSIGDTLVIPDASVIEGAANANVGAYIVTAATANTITATKRSDAANPAAVIGVITAPATVAPAAIGATPNNNIAVYSPITIVQDAADPIAGVGKTLEIGELTTGTDLLSRALRNLDDTAVDFVSTAAAPVEILSDSEYVARLVATRGQVEDDIVAGGEVGLRIGYLGTTATITISDTALTTSVTGGAGGNLSVDLAEFTTIGSLVAWLNTQPGYVAEAGNATLAQLPTTTLDNVTAQGICSVHGALNGAVKIDGYRFHLRVTQQAGLVRFADNDGELVAPALGLPAPQSSTFLSGGARGGTTAAGILDALTALESVTLNFIVPLVSRDATLDIADGLTDASSTYTREATIAATKAHCIAMSNFRNQKFRQCALSVRDTFAVARNVASNIATHRAICTFQDVRVLSPSGTIVQRQPWMAAVAAVGMQAAGTYKPLVLKRPDINGALQAAGDYNPKNLTQQEQALLAGLMPIKPGDQGGHVWVSDQTTYVSDDNFVFNSMQAVYLADLIALTLRLRVQAACVGKSVAEISAGLIRGVVTIAADDFLRLRWTAVSDDAPTGLKDLTVKIRGGAVFVGANFKVAGAIYFAPIALTYSAVEQSA